MLNALSPFILVLLVIDPASTQLRSQPAPRELSAAKGVYSARLTTDIISVPEAQSDSWWGTDRATQDITRIKLLTIYRRKEALSVPVSAYSGLLDPEKMSIVSQKRGCLIKISGSDAAGSWDCTIRVVRDQVMERVVRSGEFAELRWERTTYRYIMPGEVD